jgi:hypothetical protein
VISKSRFWLWRMPLDGKWWKKPKRGEFGKGRE